MGQFRDHGTVQDYGTVSRLWDSHEIIGQSPAQIMGQFRNNGIVSKSWGSFEIMGQYKNLGQSPDYGTATRSSDSREIIG